MTQLKIVKNYLLFLILDSRKKLHFVKSADTQRLVYRYIFAYLNTKTNKIVKIP